MANIINNFRMEFDNDEFSVFDLKIYNFTSDNI